VLYVDGELPLCTFREWLSSIMACASSGDANEDTAPLRIITPDLQDTPMPDLATATGQATIEPYLDGIELLILDNLSALCRVSEENEGGDWVPIQSWILSLRRRGITVLLLHHAGKSGSQRGTSRREDLLDIVIKLKHPADYSPDEGLRAEVHFDKGRGLYGEDAKPFEVRLQTNTDGSADWTMRSVEDVTFTRACELYNEGESVRDVAEAIGISKSKAGRLRARWKASKPSAST
jgi:putative DNA primase/helicase